MVRVLVEKSSIRPTKSGQRPKLTSECYLVRFWQELPICGWFGCYLKDIHTDQPKEAPGINLISFWQSGHLTSEVNFGLWPLLVGLIEDFSKSTLTIRKFLIPTNFSLLGPILVLECVRFSIISVPLLISISN